MTTVSDGLFQYGGQPVVSPFYQSGKAFFVKPITGSDGNTGRTLSAPFKTLAKALASATAGKNDVVYLVAEGNSASATTDYQAATLDWSKDMVHLVGINGAPMIGQRSRIAQLSTVLTIDTLFKVSANGCLISNIEIYQGVATQTATTPVAVEVTGMRNHFLNCQISGIGDVANDVAAARSLKLNAAQENLFEKCYIGLDTVIRATATEEVTMTGGCTRNIFKDCFFNTYTSASGFLMLTTTTAMDRFTLFERCLFNAAENITSAVAPTSVMSVGAINGKMLLKDCMSSGFTNYTAADNARVIMLSSIGTATSHLMGIGSAVDVT